MKDGYIERWLIKADNDLKVAENELKLSVEDMVTDAICFHAQQAVEKYLKAYLITKNIDFGRTHNLEFLLKLCTGQDPEFQQIDVKDLSFYAVQVRYPDEFYIPSVDETQEYVEIARSVRKFVLEKLEDNEQD